MVKVVVRVWSFSRRNKHSRLCLIGIFGGYEDEEAANRLYIPKYPR